MDYKFKPSVRPHWNINFKTGRRLELDLYCEELKLAIEIQGIQHYQQWAFDKNHPEEFQNRLERDQTKRENCDRMGVTLFEHKYNEKVSTLIQKIKIFIELFA